MKTPDFEKFKQIVRAYALKNAIQNNGKCDEKKVFNSIIGHLKKDYPEFTKELILNKNIK